MEESGVLLRIPDKSLKSSICLYFCLSALSSIEAAKHLQSAKYDANVNKGQSFA